LNVYAPKYETIRKFIPFNNFTHPKIIQNVKFLLSKR